MRRLTKKIDRFEGEYAFLSNFYPCVVKDPVSEWKFPTVEHYFQAMKTISYEERNEIQSAETPGKAKRLGRKCTLREDWEEKKDTIMWIGLLSKFYDNPDLRKKLIATGDAELIEGNNWHDTYWGVCNGVGENHLGKLLMRLRELMKTHKWDKENENLG